MINSEPNKDSGRKLFYGLFIFPLLIAVGMAVLLCTVVLLTREAETPESLITSIKTGTPSKRWQKAFELSNELNSSHSLIREAGVMKEIIHILRDREEYDAKTRSYMAIALNRFDGADASQALQDALAAETEPEVQLYLIWALGQRGLKESAPVIRPYLNNPQEDLRKMAVYVLASLQDQDSVGPLTKLLEDPSRDVQWNSALSLARLGSDAGYPVLMKMLDRRMLAAMDGLPEVKIEEIMVNAVKGVALLNRKEAMPYLAELADKDPSLKVRQAAIEALELQKNLK